MIKGDSKLVTKAHVKQKLAGQLEEHVNLPLQLTSSLAKFNRSRKITRRVFSPETMHGCLPRYFQALQEVSFWQMFYILSSRFVILLQVSFKFAGMFIVTAYICVSFNHNVQYWVCRLTPDWTWEFLDSNWLTSNIKNLFTERKYQWVFQHMNGSNV